MTMLDEKHETLPSREEDQNIYNLGSINHHNIVIAGLPQPGNCSAAAFVTRMRITFPKVECGLLVGIGGGVPVKTEEGFIRLGHVVVSKPIRDFPGVVQYDRGKAEQGRFEQIGSILRPVDVLLNAAQNLEVSRDTEMDDDPVWLDAQRPLRSCRMPQKFEFPGIEKDQLYHPDYTHLEPGKSCDECGCDPEQRIQRPTIQGNERCVVVHRGTIASGEQVIKDAMLRDRLAEEHGVLCFETEAVGALFDFRCLVIRGISDYCDSHKNNEWQGYAAAVAAAYARQLFFHIPLRERDQQDQRARAPQDEVPYGNLIDSERYLQDFSGQEPSEARWVMPGNVCFACDLPGHRYDQCFASEETKLKGKEARFLSGRCLFCGDHGHYQNNCPRRRF